MLQYMCHLLRTGADDRANDFDDIHQVSPHTSSAWYIRQDLNAEQPALPRLFKSHRMLQQVAPNAHGVKFIATIREPFATLVSCYEHRKQQGRLSPPGTPCPTLSEFAHSDTWIKSFHPGSIDTLWDHLVTFWRCKDASNFLLLPFEDLVAEREMWIPIIAQFMNIPCDSELIAKVAEMTSKDSMLNIVTKFDESWVIQRRRELGLPHPTILHEAAKVTNGHNVEKKALDGNLVTLHQQMWANKVEAALGIKNYAEMRRLLKEKYFKNL